MRLSDFDYELPEELIAQEPPPERDGARMLVLHRAEQRMEDRLFRDLPEFLHSGDCLVLNDSRVLPSRLFGHRDKSTGAIEVMLIEPVNADARDWRALVRPGRKVRLGTVVRFDNDFSATIVEHGERGERIVRFAPGIDVYAALDRLGHMPLPPYIRRGESTKDRERYQTVFARERGSVAAPTAGLHFTQEVIGRCEAAGANVARVTLHVGLGTFQPIDREDFENHQLHYERYSIGVEAQSAIQAAQRVVAVGTTSVRTLESAARLPPALAPAEQSTTRLPSRDCEGVGTAAPVRLQHSQRSEGVTNLFLYPGAEFQKVGAMLTNFHLPRTSLLLLVCAFAGTDFAMAAYHHAVEQKYRFFSYGDCMLIL